MATSLMPRVASDDLRAVSLADAPDYITAVHAGEAHGLVPTQALKSAFGKWLSDNAESVQHYGLADFYEGFDTSRAMVNESRLLHFLTIVLAEQGAEIQRLKAQMSTSAIATPARLDNQSSQLASRVGDNA